MLSLLRLLYCLTCYALFVQTTLGQPSGFGYGRQILIQGTKISGGSALIDFPVLVSVTLPELRLVSSGGHVQNANGYDIVFTKADCSTVLGHQIESYDATTGRLVAWVLVPSLAPGINFNLHMYYGKSGVTIDPSSNTVWNGYHGAWHFQGGSMSDNTSNGYTASNNGTTTQSPAYINDGRAASGTQWMQLATFPNITTSFSMSAWIHTTDNSYPGQRVFQDDENNTGGYAMSLGDGGTGMLRFYSRASDPVILDTPGNTILNNTWYYVTEVVDMAAMMKYIYVNGALAASGSFVNAWGTDSGPATMAGETALGETANRFKGQLDEIRVARKPLSAGWIATEYNNQKTPSSFYAVSTEYTASGLCFALPIELLAFNATSRSSTEVEVTWTTASESNNDHFTVERSPDAASWDALGTLDGAGNSTVAHDYVFIDDSPLPGVSYYRLRQTDIDGTSTWSNVRAVSRLAATTAPVIVPNPADQQVIISGVGQEPFTLRDATGRAIATGRSNQPFDASGLPEGLYHIRMNGSTGNGSTTLVVRH